VLLAVLFLVVGSRVVIGEAREFLLQVGFAFPGALVGASVAATRNPRKLGLDGLETAAQRRGAVPSDPAARDQALTALRRRHEHMQRRRWPYPTVGGLSLLVIAGATLTRTLHAWEPWLVVGILLGIGLTPGLIIGRLERRIRLLSSDSNGTTDPGSD